MQHRSFRLRTYTLILVVQTRIENTTTSRLSVENEASSSTVRYVLDTIKTGYLISYFILWSMPGFIWSRVELSVITDDWWLMSNEPISFKMISITHYEEGRSRFRCSMWFLWYLEISSLCFVKTNLTRSVLKYWYQTSDNRRWTSHISRHISRKCTCLHSLKCAMLPLSLVLLFGIFYRACLSTNSTSESPTNSPSAALKVLPVVSVPSISPNETKWDLAYSTTSLKDVVSVDVVKSIFELHQRSKYNRDSSWSCVQYDDILIKKNVVVKIFATGLEDLKSILLVTDTVVYNVELWWCIIFSFLFISLSSH